MIPAILKNPSSREWFSVTTLLEWCPEFKIIVQSLSWIWASWKNGRKTDKGFSVRQMPVPKWRYLLLVSSWSHGSRLKEDIFLATRKAPLGTTIFQDIYHTLQPQKRIWWLPGVKFHMRGLCPSWEEETTKFYSDVTKMEEETPDSVVPQRSSIKQLSPNKTSSRRAL